MGEDTKSGVAGSGGRVEELKERRLALRGKKEEGA